MVGAAVTGVVVGAEVGAATVVGVAVVVGAKLEEVAAAGSEVGAALSVDPFEPPSATTPTVAIAATTPIGKAIFQRRPRFLDA